jgi:hypothetical protein
VLGTVHLTMIGLETGVFTRGVIITNPFEGSRMYSDIHIAIALIKSPIPI